MTATAKNPVLAELAGPRSGAALYLKRAVLVVAGVALLTLAAKIRVPMWPVPMTMGTFAVLVIGAAYGARLGLTTVLAYLLVGALGFDVFAATSGQAVGIAYMLGGTGGYLVGFALAAAVLGQLAARGWDRSFGWMALALLIGNLVIYLPGVAWLGHLYGWDKPLLSWGVAPFLLGDAVKLVLAAMLVPGLWRLVGKARA